MTVAVVVVVVVAVVCPVVIVSSSSNARARATDWSAGQLPEKELIVPECSCNLQQRSIASRASARAKQQ